MEEWEQYPELQSRLASSIGQFTLPEHYTVKNKRGMDRVAQLAVFATELALRHAGLYQDALLGNGRTGVAYGSANGSADAAMEFFSMLENKSMKRLRGTTYLRMMNHSAAINISVLFGTTGRLYTANSACTAGSQGIGYGYEAIKYGLQDIMIAGGSEALCPAQAAIFDIAYSASTRNTHPEETPRPFDQDRDGLVIGEGATTLILEEREHALARGAPILAEIVSFATNTDGFHLVEPKQKTIARVMRDALAAAQLPANAIAYINGHGTSTVRGDIVESCATEEVMGSQIPFSTLKSYLGHSLGASASLEAWLSIKMLEEGWCCPSVNLVNIDKDCGHLDYVQGEPRKIEGDCFMTNNFAFGGVNTSLIIRVCR